MIWRSCWGFGDAGECVEKKFGGIDDAEVDFEVAFEGGF